MPHIRQVGVLEEIVVRIVLQHKNTVGQQHVFPQYQIRNGVYGGQGVRWPGKNIVVLLGAVFDKTEHIHLHDFKLCLYVELLRRFAHKLHGGREFVHIGNIFATARDELVAVAAGAAEEVEHFGRLKIEDIVQDIKKCLFRVVRCRARGPMVGWRVKAPALKFSADDTHGIL